MDMDAMYNCNYSAMERAIKKKKLVGFAKMIDHLHLPRPPVSTAELLYQERAMKYATGIIVQ